jgi:glutaredoxin
VHVTLLTQQACGFCDEAKALLERLAAEYPLEVAELDLSSPEGERMALEGGVMFPPGIFLDGEAFAYGRPSERKLRRELERRLR